MAVVFTAEKMKAIKTVAIQFGFTELTGKPGVFMDDKKNVINTNFKSGVSGYTTLPLVGSMNAQSIPDENTDSPTVEQVREAIQLAFKQLPKTAPKVVHESATQGEEYSAKKQEYKGAIPGNIPEAPKVDFMPKERPTAPLIDDLKKKEEVKHDESKTAIAQEVSASTQKPPEPAKPIKIISCCVCGFEIPHAEALRQAEDGIRPKEMKCAECAEKKSEPKQAEVMPQQKRTSPPQKGLPIKTVTQKGLMIKNFVPRCAEIGGIRIGIKGDKTTSSGFRLPEKLDHFIVTTPNKDKAGNFIIDDVMSLLPENPRKLNIMLLYDDETMNFSTQFREIKGGRIVCSGDGEKAYDRRAGQEIICNIDTCPKYLDNKCKLNGILSVILLDKPTIGGVYRFRTTGWNSVQSIMTSMLLIKTMTRGLLAMIPLTLTLTPKIVTPKGAEKSHTIYFVNIEYHGTNLLEKVLEVSKHRMLMQSEIMKLENQSLLLAPESEEELKDIQEEFYHEKE